MHDITGVHHIATWGQDLAKTRAFYTGVLGLPEIVGPEVVGIAEFKARPVASFACGGLDRAQFAALSIFRAQPAPDVAKDPAPSGAIVLASPRGGLPLWHRRLMEHGVRITGRAWAFDEEHLCFTDPDGFDLAIVEDPANSSANALDGADMASPRILRLKSAEFPAHGQDNEIRKLLQLLGLPIAAQDGPVTRFQIEGAGPFEFVDIFTRPQPASAPPTASRILQLAFWVKNHLALARLSRVISDHGYKVFQSGPPSISLWIGLPRSEGILLALYSGDFGPNTEPRADET